MCPPLAPTRLTQPLSEHAPRAYSNEPQAAQGPPDAPTIHGTLIDTKILAQNEDKPPTWDRAASRGEHHDVINFSRYILFYFRVLLSIYYAEFLNFHTLLELLEI